MGSGDKRDNGVMGSGEIEKIMGSDPDIPNRSSR